jgi:tetratricopeptide (TPR) repeat protein
MQTEFPLGLRQSLEAGDCVLFVGAGIGRHLKASDGGCAPDATELAHELADHFAFETATYKLPKISELVEVRKTRPQLLDFLRKRLANLTPDDDLIWITSQPWRAIFTTNYDLGIERAYELAEKPVQRAIPIMQTSELASYDPRFEVPIYHLHGTLFGGHESIVITQTDYVKFRDRRRMLFELLKKEFATSTLLYIGYSNEDPNWTLIQEEISAEFYPRQLPVSYRIAPETDPVDLELLRAKGVETISVTYQEFVALAVSALAGIEVDPDRLKRIRSTVPSQLVSAFEKTPAAVARLLNSWVYVNQAAFNEVPNTQAFLQGDRPNWGLIANSHHFERDIEEEIYDDLLDYATSGATRPTLSLILGPAGYGMTTTLMSVAAHLVKEKVGPVFMHKLGTPLTEGDILFASSLFPESPFFLVDNAADYSQQLQSAVTHLRGEHRRGAFVFAERKNEWLQRRGRLSGKQFLIETLSDTEINRLLHCLGKHNALNKLESLPRDLQFSVVREKHGKELLVAMREATEGKGFDAIIEDEYRAISSPLAMESYLITCCFSQHGAYIRDTLLASMLKCELSELYDKINAELEGVIIFESIDDARGLYAARARHRVIATIVWDRCGGRSERDRVLQLGLESLNLMYKADRDAFDKFVRSDHLIDEIHGLENKLKFFETACKKEPDNPFVRQHYARMLLREGNAELALAQIEEGIKISRGAPPRVVVHTKGIILGQLALTAANVDIARRRLVQSEDAFHTATAMNPRDEYGYHSLASLYLDWAKKKALTEVEAAEYIAKAEEVISIGLKKAGDREGLWIVSSEIDKWLGDIPSRFKALQNAVQENPAGTVGRYILGRAYRRNNQADEAIRVLEPVIKSYQEEFRAFIEYSLALLDLGRPLNEAIAVLRISTTYGLADPRYIATLGGLLFLNGEFNEANKVFQESTRREFSTLELHTVYFKPLKPATRDPYVLTGRVLVVKPRYSLIEVQGYPKFLCHSSKYGGVQLKHGITVSFQIQFSANGVIADHPVIVE